MLARYSDPMTPDYMKEHCRYKIWQHSSGEFDKANVVAFCDTVADARKLVRALGLLEENHTYEYELCADFSQLKDV
ncbi:MAG: hypothetical protein PUA62_01240 [Lachnospiraceae bacterium]|nr:hypothetical protein [Lachnospiraceae bacterium]